MDVLELEEDQSKFKADTKNTKKKELNNIKISTTIYVLNTHAVSKMNSCSRLVS